MSSESAFSEETLKYLVKNKLQLDKSEKLKYSLQKCSKNENILSLKFFGEKEKLDMDHLLIKIKDDEDIPRKQLEYSNTLKNLFTIQDDNQNVYLGFARSGTSYPHKNNLENLSTILKNLAYFQANNLVNRKEISVHNCKYKIEEISKSIVSLDYFKTLDQPHVNGVISKLQNEVDELFENGLLVKSIGNIFANNVYIIGLEKCIFLDLGYKMFRSPVYDALVYIFALSDEQFRQHHFKSLLRLYYEAFTEALSNNNNSVAASIFDINVFEHHLKIFLSIVKFELSSYLIQKEKKTHEERRYLEELLKNILYYFKYPQVSYEDCLEAVSKKLGTTKFKLVDYQLVPLDEKNGCLGEYFFVKSRVENLDKIEELSMFAKILNTGNSVLQELAQSGPSLNEQFFFRTLIPLFKEYGLESIVDFAAECYFDRLDDVLIFEDLVKLNYKPFNPNARISYDVLKLSFLKAAKLHACTLLLEERMSKCKGTKVRLGNIYGEYMKDWIFEVREGLPKTPANIIDSKPGLDELIDTFVDIPKDISLEEFHKRVDDICDVFLQRVNHPADQFRNVVCHGDYYISNLLVKYDQNNIAENIYMVDFQALRYAPIVSDVLMLAYFSAEKEERDKYLNKLLEDYYQEMKKIMSEFKYDINKFYTPTQFTECVKYMKPVAIIAAICYGPLMALPADKRNEIISDKVKFEYYFYKNKREYIKHVLSISEHVKIYLRGLIEDLYNFCIN